MTKKTDKVIRHCCLVGAHLERADLRGRNLEGVNLTNTNLRGADLSGANLRGAILIKADLSRACLYQADCEGADFSSADMSMCYARAAVFKDARMWFVSMRNLMAKEAYFIGTDLLGSDLLNAFLIGAKFDGANLTGVRNLDRAIFRWWMNPKGGPPSYEPKPGYVEVDRSLLGDISLQENAARRYGND